MADVQAWRDSPSWDRALVFFLWWRLRNATVFWWRREIWEAVEDKSECLKTFVLQFREVFVETYKNDSLFLCYVSLNLI